MESKIKKNSYFLNSLRQKISGNIYIKPVFDKVDGFSYFIVIHKKISIYDLNYNQICILEFSMHGIIFMLNILIPFELFIDI